ncbi:MAG: DUF1566 domain-containing protein [Candidatus Schekmanbacteria bacterium]|nr:DUF1566 domain-containing protein [Candidatus Schekmanbacteria bacterium]
MRKVKSILLFCIIAVLLMPFICLSISEAGGTIELPQTGQTTSYATGDDGDIQTGTAWPSPRFTDNGNETITDNLTGLMWTKDANLSDIATWQGALDYVASLNSSSYLGFNDWRLPNVNELKSLVNANESSVSAWLTAQGFNNIQPSYYWTSTTYSYDTYNRWYVHMLTGLVGSSGKGNFYDIWPVRSGSGSSTISLPQTGQTISYATGDDGDIQAGAAWPSSRFTDNGDSTVTDNLTGLMWTKDGNLSVGTTWQGALDYIASLNSSNYLGFNDWYLPNVNELKSLVNANEDYTSNWLNSQGFSNVQSVKYWSSSTYANSTDSSWYVNMWYGDSGFNDKGISNFVWPVRSGQSSGQCVYTISVSDEEFDHTGGTGNLVITTTNDCDWTASSDSGWLVITPTISGIGSETITYTVSANTGADLRTAIISVQGVTHTITQTGVVAESFPDLTTISIKCQKTVKKGKKLNVSITVKNIGTVKSDKSRLSLYLSSSDSLSVGDGEKSIVSKVINNLNKQKALTMTFKFKIKKAKGNYYVKAFCDSDNTITESDESNNIAVKKIIVK